MALNAKFDAAPAERTRARTTRTSQGGGGGPRKIWRSTHGAPVVGSRWFNVAMRCEDQGGDSLSEPAGRRS